MKLNKQTYREIGKVRAMQDSIIGRLPADGYPCGGDAPPVAMNGSWQAMAWKAGYDEMRAVIWGSPTVRRHQRAAGAMYYAPGDDFKHSGKLYRVTAVFPVGNVGTALCNGLNEKNPDGQYAVIAEKDGQIICAARDDAGRTATF